MLPDHSEIVRDLKLLRERGLIRLRGLDLPALHRATVLAGLSTNDGPNPLQTERMVRCAVAALGDEEPGRATQYLFGLVPGTAGRKPTDLRERAALEYNRLSAETFRKDAEKRLIDRVADEILRLCLAAGTNGAPTRLAEEPGPQRPQEPTGPTVSDRELRSHLRESLQHVLTLEDGPGTIGSGIYHLARYGPFAMPSGPARTPVWVRLGGDPGDRRRRRRGLLGKRLPRTVPSFYLHPFWAATQRRRRARSGRFDDP